MAFFGCLYYAGLRPGEAVELDEEGVKDVPNNGWGTLWLRTSAPSVGTVWNDGRGRRQRRQRRQLKHRSVKEVRPVPCSPPLTELLNAHIMEFGFASNGRLFRGERGGDLSDSIYGRAWEHARSATLTPAQVDSPLAKRPYDLRHTCLSTWLNAGVDPTQVAAWAGNSVAVLLRVYAKCIAGRDEIARKRIEAALVDSE